MQSQSKKEIKLLKTIIEGIRLDTRICNVVIYGDFNLNLSNRKTRRWLKNLKPSCIQNNYSYTELDNHTTGNEEQASYENASGFLHQLLPEWQDPIRLKHIERTRNAWKWPFPCSDNDPTGRSTRIYQENDRKQQTARSDYRKDNRISSDLNHIMQKKSKKDYWQYRTRS